MPFYAPEKGYSTPYAVSRHQHTYPLTRRVYVALVCMGFISNQPAVTSRSRSTPGNTHDTRATRYTTLERKCPVVSLRRATDRLNVLVGTGTTLHPL